MRATFKIFNTGSTATGFLLQDDAPGATRTNAILVTANHTFKKAKGDHILLVCRVKNDRDEWMRQDFKVMIRNGTNALWTCHPSQDVAVIRCVLPPNAVFQALPQKAVADETAIAKRGVTVGSHFFYFGYPFRTEANDAGFPLYREGMVSGYPLLPSRLHPTFPFSAFTFAGDSGAPVVLADSPPDDLLLLGLVIAGTRQNDTVKSENWDFTFKRDMGLGTIVQAVFIRETLRLLK